MKNFVKGSLLAVMVGCTFLYSNVEAKNVYFTSDNGVEMTELEYLKMLQIFSERRLESVTQEEFDLYKDANIVDSDVIYQKTVYKDGSVISEELLTEEEYNAISDAEVSDGITPYDSDNKSTETTYKRLKATLTDIGSKKYILTAGLSWKKIPATKSYDVFAFRLSNFSYSGFAGTQSYYINGVRQNSIQYNTSSEGYKGLSNGAGVSMNLVDGSITAYELAITADLSATTGNSQAHAYVSYQHSQSDLTRAQSMGYTLDASGLGNVVLFSNSTIRNKYDGMSGVHLTTPI